MYVSGLTILGSEDQTLTPKKLIFSQTSLPLISENLICLKVVFPVCFHNNKLLPGVCPFGPGRRLPPP